MKNAYLNPGAHVDLTTLLGVIDVLKLMGSNNHQPITYDLLINFSQFLEAVVFHDQLFYENSHQSSYRSYIELIQESGIQKLIGGEFLVPHEFQDLDDELKLEAVTWAIGQAQRAPAEALRYAVALRANPYRGIAAIKKIADAENPMKDEYLQLVASCGDAECEIGLGKALADLELKGIGQLGMHVLVRIYLLHALTASKNNLSYLPHFSRIPLVESTIKEGGPSLTPFRRWSMEKLRHGYLEHLEELTEPEERSGLMLKLSPVFLYCLKDSSHPRDVFNRALELRDHRHARKFRAHCRKLEQDILKNSPSESVSRGLVIKALADLDEIIKSKTSYTLTVGWTLTGPTVTVGMARSLTGFPKPYRSLLFLTDILGKALGMFHADAQIRKIFGAITEDDSFIVTSRLFNS